MIDRTSELPVAHQAKLLGISRGSVYYQPQPVRDADLKIMRVIDEMHLEHPWAGARTLRDWLVRAGHAVGRKHVATLMRRVGIPAIQCKPNTSRRHPANPICPCLLRKVSITRPNQMWAMDITFIPMAKGFVYLAAVMDWATRRVLSWRVSNAMETDFCIEAVEETLSK